ncbi:putative manganese transporter, partial [Balneolaceae bacterium ANBcel3]|nr:putative manganese transporter [Balneolaceae bacterium ANBcel3]
MATFAHVLSHALMITGFVFVMMLVIEYVNVLSRGMLIKYARSSFLGQYVIAGLLGLIPGCLGAFTVVAMYSHRMFSLGALVTAMIATSGDEAFVMLSLFPHDALLLFALLFLISIPAGLSVDVVAGKYRPVWMKGIGYHSTEELPCEGFQIHSGESCHLFSLNNFKEKWKEAAGIRSILLAVLV